MKNKIISPLLALALAICAGQEVHAQGTNVPLSTITNVDQVNSKNWVLDLSIDDPLMESARMRALQSVDRYIREKLDAEDMPQGDLIQKILTIDEDFQGGTYSAKFRVVSWMEDPAYQISEMNAAFYENAPVDKIDTPSWVLLVPVTIKEDGGWDLNSMQQVWSNAWKVPFVDGTTQFIPATIDADDIAFSHEAGDFFDISIHLAQRYGATDILYVAISDENELFISRWGEQLDAMPTMQAGTAVSKADVTHIRGLVLEKFWESFSDPHAGYTSYQMEDLSQQRLKYRLIGFPEEDGAMLYGYIQLIPDAGMAQRDIDEIMKNIEGLTLLPVVGYEDQAIYQYQLPNGDVNDLNARLEAAGLRLD